MRRTRLTATIGLSAAVLALAACGSSGGGDAKSAGPTKSTTASTAAATVCAGIDPAGTDELAAVCKKGSIMVSTDPAYPPQSKLNKDTNEYEGFDIDRSLLGRDHRRRLEWPLGHVGRVDDRH